MKFRLYQHCYRTDDYLIYDDFEETEQELNVMIEVLQEGGDDLPTEWAVYIDGVCHTKSDGFAMIPRVFNYEDVKCSECCGYGGDSWYAFDINIGAVETWTECTACNGIGRIIPNEENHNK